MDKELLCTWLEEKIEEASKFKGKDQSNQAYMLGAVTALKEILNQVENGKFNNK